MLSPGGRTLVGKCLLPARRNGEVRRDRDLYRFMFASEIAVTGVPNKIVIYKLELF